MTRTIRNRIAQFVGVVLALFAGSAVAAAVAQTESAKPEVVLLVAGKAAENPAGSRTGQGRIRPHRRAAARRAHHRRPARRHASVRRPRLRHDRHRRRRPPDRRRSRRRPLPRRSVRRHGFEPARPRIVALAEPGPPVRLSTRAATMSKYAGNKWVTLVLVCLAQFMVILDATIVNIALPAIQTDLDFTDANLQWVVNGYTLLFGGFLLLGGRAADILGRKRIFIAGVILFSVASLLNGLATNAGQLVAFRALQGLGGALVSPAALSIITTTFAEGPERTKALGVWGAIAAGGGAFGLLLGGVLVEALSWEWVFFVNVPIGIAAAFLSCAPDRRVQGRARRRVRHRRRRARDARPDGARVRDRARRAERLGLGHDARPRRRRARPAGRVRRRRGADPRPAGPAGHLQDPHARGQQPRAAAGRRRAVRPVLLRVAVRAADPRLLADRGRPRVPAGDGGHPARLGDRAGGREAVRRVRATRWSAW